MKHVIDLNDLERAEWDGLLSKTNEIIASPLDFKNACSGRVLASLFYEPSTRTSFSFQAAMLRLGGGVFGFSDPNATSAAKGETLKDTMVMVSGYADVIVMRHPKEGAARAASLYSSCPVINAGDGGHLHPTQTLTDLATITRLRGKIDGAVVGLCGDLKNGRTVHSLVRALSRYKDINLILISPRELAVPPYLRQMLNESSMKFIEVTNLEATLPQLDCLYMTRIQKERFIDPLEYERLKGVYVLTPQKLKIAKSDLLIMHPLPRVDEIHAGVDEDERAKYFVQAETGMYARMALIMYLIGEKGKDFVRERSYNDSRMCKYSNCITAIEGYLPAKSTEGRCAYCDHEI